VAHRGVEKLGPLALHELHDALPDPHEVEEGVVGLAEDVHDGVADADGGVALGHSGVFSS
jgi:hypothetical protein